MGFGGGTFEMPLYAPSHSILPTATPNSIPMTVVSMTKVNPAFRIKTAPRTRANNAVIMVAAGKLSQKDRLNFVTSMAEA